MRDGSAHTVSNTQDPFGSDPSKPSHTKKYAKQWPIDEQAENHAAIILMSKCDSTCRSEHKQCCKWVQSQAAPVTPEAPFLSRDNVDHHFARVISRLAGLVNGMTRVINALEWHAAKVEHVGAMPAFVVRSPLVESALVLQKVFNVENGGAANPGSDPHKGLEDILPESSQLTCMRHIHGECDDWRSSGLNFALGMQGAIRAASVTKFTCGQSSLVQTLVLSHLSFRKGRCMSMDTKPTNRHVHGVMKNGCCAATSLLRPTSFLRCWRMKSLIFVNLTKMHGLPGGALLQLIGLNTMVSRVWCFVLRSLSNFVLHCT
jgi:hypothetical protein